MDQAVARLHAQLTDQPLSVVAPVLRTTTLAWKPLGHWPFSRYETAQAGAGGGGVVVVCAGVQGALALDDAFVAGRIVELLGWERTDAAEAAARLVSTWSGAEVAFRTSRSGRNLMENAPELEPDIPFCARESVLDIVPRLVAMRDGAAEISL